MLPMLSARVCRPLKFRENPARSNCNFNNEQATRRKKGIESSFQMLTSSYIENRVITILQQKMSIARHCRIWPNSSSEFWEMKQITRFKLRQKQHEANPSGGLRSFSPWLRDEARRDQTSSSPSPGLSQTPRESRTRPPSRRPRRTSDRSPRAPPAALVAGSSDRFALAWRGGRARGRPGRRQRRAASGGIERSRRRREGRKAEAFGRGRRRRGAGTAAEGGGADREERSKGRS